MTIALDRRMRESGPDLIPGRRPRMPFDRDYTFGEDVDRVFLDAPSARLSRALENSQRNVQKWIAGHEGSPPHAREFIADQLARIEKQPVHPYLAMRGEALKLIDDEGLHPEVVAGYLSKLYDEITNKPIR
ncbi:hypothetical protein ASD04_06995 [Devosia sp. Root436]|uniref:hypothetical protein n=1 Tax=Devosia sp. Root436 TaxID=1736537 RepID=UPI0006F9395D|nr:hypothetical protein [Devosia sp. Root436]KQX40369.1 hypothetical protein ASD04_06995 [Devosia sp. Root436]